MYQLRTQLSQLQDYLRDDEAATQSTFTAEPDTSESDSSEDEEPDTPSYVRPDLDNLNMPVHVVGLDAMQLATAANEAAQHQEGVEGPAPAEQKQVCERAHVRARVCGVALKAERECVEHVCMHRSVAVERHVI